MIPVHTRVKYALGYLELGAFAAAGMELDAIAPADARLPEVLTIRLELAMAEKDWATVIRLAPEVIATAPADERAWIAWAYALRERGEIAAARDVLLRGDPLIARRSVLMDYNLACYLALLGDLDGARSRLEKVFAREPDWRAEAAADPDLAALQVNP